MPSGGADREVRERVALGGFPVRTSREDQRVSVHRESQKPSVLTSMWYSVSDLAPSCVTVMRIASDEGAHSTKPMGRGRSSTRWAGQEVLPSPCSVCRVTELGAVIAANETGPIYRGREPGAGALAPAQWPSPTRSKALRRAVEAT